MNLKDFKGKHIITSEKDSTLRGFAFPYLIYLIVFPRTLRKFFLKLFRDFITNFLPFYFFNLHLFKAGTLSSV